MKRLRRIHSLNQAFTLVEMAIVIIILGMTTGLVLKTQKVTKPDACYAKTQAQMVEIKKAIEAFVQKNGRYPAPSFRRNILDQNDQSTFGLEMDYDSKSNKAVDHSTTLVDGVVFGALPFATLGLPIEFDSDCWGNRFTYKVSRNFTSISCQNWLDKAKGMITIHDGNRGTDIVTGGTTKGAVYAVISHGADGVGAVRSSSTSLSMNNLPIDYQWCSASSYTPGHVPLDITNCDLNTVVNVAAFNQGDIPENHFDDVVMWSGNSFSPTLKSSSNIYCWGNRRYGAGGNGCEDYNSSDPIGVTLPENLTSFQKLSVAKDLWAGCGIGNDQKLYCWGQAQLKLTSDPDQGYYGSFTDNNGVYHEPIQTYKSSYYPQKVNFPGNENIIDVSAGSTFCAIDSNFLGWCWGDNLYGSAGINSTNSFVSVPTRISLNETLFSIKSAGGVTCALTKTNKNYCWGRNDFGQLGVGDTVNKKIPTQTVYPSGVSYFKKIASTPTKGGYGEELDIYNYGDINYGHYSCAEGDNDRFYCWGSTFVAYGQSYFSLSGTGFTEITLPSGAAPIKSMDLLPGKVCILGNNNRIYCARFLDYNDATYHSMYVTNGFQEIPQTVLGSTGESVISTTASCALTSSQNVYCFSGPNSALSQPMNKPEKTNGFSEIQAGGSGLYGMSCGTAIPIP